MRNIVTTLDALTLLLVCKTALGKERVALEKEFVKKIKLVYDKWWMLFIERLKRDGIVLVMQQAAQSALLSNPFVMNGNAEKKFVENLTFIVQGAKVDIDKSEIEIIHFDMFLQGFDLGITTGIESLKLLRMKAAADDEIVFELTDAELINTIRRRIRVLTKAGVDSVVLRALRIIGNEIFIKKRDLFQVMDELEKLGISPERAFTIVQTEIQAALGLARHEMYKRSGVQRRKWMTVGDNRVRRGHELNEQKGWVKIGDRFPDGSKYPGDPSSPDHGINCRCVEVPDLSDPSLLLQPWEGSSSIDLPAFPMDLPLSGDVFAFT